MWEISSTVLLNFNDAISYGKSKYINNSLEKKMELSKLNDALNEQYKELLAADASLQPQVISKAYEISDMGVNVIVKMERTCTNQKRYEYLLKKNIAMGNHKGCLDTAHVELDTPVVENGVQGTEESKAKVYEVVLGYFNKWSGPGLYFTPYIAFNAVSINGKPISLTGSI